MTITDTAALIGGLRKLYSDPINRAALNHFAAGSEPSATTTVEHLCDIVWQELPGASRSDIVRLCQALERLGCARFVVGRRSHPSRLVWNISPKRIGKVASGEWDVLEPMADQEQRPAGETIESEELIVHPYTLRPNLQIEIKLPRTLTAREAERVANFIRTLPFEQ